MISTFLRRAAVGAAATATALGVALVSPVSGSTSSADDDGPDLVAVRFDLAPADSSAGDDPLSPAGSDTISHYVELQVDHGGVTRRLRPVTGSVTATPLVTAPATSVEIDGLRIGPAADGFDSTLGRALGSASVGSFARIDTGGVGEPAVIQLDLGRALGSGDYLLVQEAGGDATIEIEALGADGGVVGARTVGPSYRWKSSHRTPDGSVQWASVVDVTDWAATGEVTGLLVKAATAEVKVLVLEPAVGVIPLPLADAEIDQGAASGSTGDGRPSGPPSSAAPDPIPSPTSVQAPDPGPATDAASGSAPPTPTTTPPTPTTAPPASTTSSVPSPPLVEEPGPASNGGPASRILQQAEVPMPTALAMTGVSTDPWVLVTLATGLIFFGYTAVAAFRRPTDEATTGEPSGHAQLDALGFD